MKLAYNSIHRKKLSLPSILSIFLLGGLAAMGAVLSVNLAYGFLFWPDKPAKPDMGVVTNPLLIAEFDKLYDKYPNINQVDIDQLYFDTSLICYNGAHQSVMENNPESADSPLGQLIGSKLCSSLMSGAIENYLSQLKIEYSSMKSLTLLEYSTPPIFTNIGIIHYFKTNILRNN